ncbi:MAG: TlyA family RNA methyltransferase [Acidimicrobiia bacterium]|nr:TlyA family RNA methyltransferase [Acidimicrobiia bacterium]
MTDLRQRLDVVLTQRGTTTTRSLARRLIREGRVLVDGAIEVRPGRLVAGDVGLRVEADLGLVGRGGEKLDAALAGFPLSVEGLEAFDAGASTGGFTQVLLRRGARSVTAVDVGRDQLARVLRNDQRVTVVEGLNLRDVDETTFGRTFDVVVADLSFISLRLVVSGLSTVAAPAAPLILLVKPQFEVGKARLPRTGVVVNPDHRRDAVRSVAVAYEQAGWGVSAVLASPVPGTDGNRETFLLLRRGIPGIAVGEGIA